MTYTWSFHNQPSRVCTNLKFKVNVYTDFHQPSYQTMPVDTCRLPQALLWASKNREINKSCKNMLIRQYCDDNHDASGIFFLLNIHQHLVSGQM